MTFFAPWDKSNRNSMYDKLYLYSINIPGFKRQIKFIQIWVKSKQIYNEVDPNKFKYPMHDELCFLKPHKSTMNSVFKS